MANETSQQLGTYLRDGQTYLDRGQFARAEDQFARALAVAPDNEAARHGLRRARAELGTEVVSSDHSNDDSIDWQAHYDAGADASVDLPPPLSRDLVNDTLSAPVLDELDEAPVDEAGASDAEVSGSHGNPPTDPFTRVQSYFSTPVDKDGERPVVTRIEIKERAIQPPSEGEREVNDTEPPSHEFGVPVSTADVRSPQAALLKPEGRDSQLPGNVVPTPELAQGSSYDTLEDSTDIDPGEMEIDALLILAERRHKAGDFAGANGLLERLLAEAPDHEKGRRLNAENTQRLMKVFEARLGDLERSPKLRLRQEEFVWQSLNHHEGFVLSQVDGMTTYTDLIEISTLPRLEVVRILARLVELGIVG